jgi:capsular polysaccharide biosynthesis protein
MSTLPISTIGRALRTKLWLIVLLALGAGVVAYEASLVRPQVYEASTLVSIDESQSTTQGFDVAMQADQFLAQRFISLGTSREVLQDVCAKEGPACNPSALGRQVRVTTPQATAQLLIVADASAPSTAARLANETADALIARNRAQVDQRMAAQVALLQGQLAQLGVQLNQALQQASAAEKAGQSNATTVAQLSFVQTEYSSTYQRLQDLQVRRTQQADVLSIEQRAARPGKPVDPDPVRYVLVGLAGGLLAGVLVALVAEGTRTRIGRSSDLAEVAGTDIVIDFGRELLPGAGRPYAFLARVSLADGEEPAGQPLALLLVGSTVWERVNEVGKELASSVAASGRRVLVLLAPTPRGGWLRRKQDNSSSKILVEPDGSNGQPVPRWSGDEVDLVIHCSLPPMLDPSSTWLGATPERAILVATKGVTRFGQARRTAETLERVGVQVVASILLPYRLKPAPRAPVAHRPPPEPTPSAAAAFER